jgi:SAM-dependent methyltransferase
VLLDYGTVEGLEMSPTALELCRKQFGARVGLHQGALPGGIPERGAYGLVTAFDVLEHIPDSQLAPALDAIREALRPGGQFVCTVPAFQFLWSEHDEVHHHHRRYTRQLLTRQLSQAGLEVRWCSYFNTLLFPPIAAVRLLARALPRREQKSHLGSGPGAVNALLSALFSAERHLVPRWSLPFGVSLVAVCQRSAEAASPAQTLAA